MCLPELSWPDPILLMENSFHGQDAFNFLHFVESSHFTKSWNELGLNDEADLSTLQIAIMSNPQMGNVVAGTGGLRKMRFSTPAQGRGKRGAYRVCYVYFEEYDVAYLMLIYMKNEKDDLSSAEKRKIKELIEGIGEELERLQHLK